MINKTKERALFEEYYSKDCNFTNTLYKEDEHYGTYVGKTSHDDDYIEAKEQTYMWWGWCDRLVLLIKEGYKYET